MVDKEASSACSTDTEQGNAESSARDPVAEARAWHKAQAENVPSEEEQAWEESSKRRKGIQGNDVLFRLWKEGKVQTPPSIPADNGETDLAKKFDPALREFTVQRDDNLPLQFQGYLIGWNEVDKSVVSYGTQVCIFATKSGKIITSVHQWQRSETKERQRHAAKVHDTPEDALQTLIEDGGNRLGPASREAWELACRIWAPLQGREVEVVD